MRPSILQRLGVLALTVGAAAASACLCLLVFAPDFGLALGQFFLAPFSSSYYLGKVLAGMAPLVVAGLGVAVAFSSKNFNLGGEGQVYVGGLAAALTAARFGANPLIAWLAAAAAAALSGGLLGGFSGLLKRRLGIDELISSFLTSSVALLLVDFLIAGPLRDESSNFQSTAPLTPSLLFPKLLPPSTLSSAIFLALAAAFIGKFVMGKTRFGFELRLCGQSAEFARYAGIDGGFYSEAALSLSGALHGLAGALLVFGSYGAAIKGFSSGTGWSAIAVSLIARNDPIALLPAAFFYSYLETGAQSVQLGSSVSSEMAGVVQAFILLFATASSLSGRRLGAGRGKRP